MAWAQEDPGGHRPFGQWIRDEIASGRMNSWPVDDRLAPQALAMKLNSRIVVLNMT